MSRRNLVAIALLLIAAPLTAQMKHDHDQKVQGGGTLAKGWSARVDGDEAMDSKVAPMGNGIHVTSGHAALYWPDAGTEVKGPMTATVTIQQTKAPEHPEAYGIFFMGKDLKSENQNYAYFLVRGDGKFMVNHRAGKELHKILPWTDNAAVTKADAKGVSTNTLTVDATKPDSVRLLVNGKQVHALDKAHLGATDGIVGVRVNHNLDVHVSDLKVTPKK